MYIVYHIVFEIMRFWRRSPKMNILDLVALLQHTTFMQKVTNMHIILWLHVSNGLCKTHPFIKRARFADQDSPRYTDCSCRTLDWETANSYRDVPNGPLELLLGALDSQCRDVPRNTEIISKFPVVVQAGRSAYPSLNTKRCLSNPIDCPTAPVGHTIWSRKHRLVNGVKRDIPTCESSAPICNYAVQ